MLKNKYGYIFAFHLKCGSVFAHFLLYYCRRKWVDVQLWKTQRWLNQDIPTHAIQFDVLHYTNLYGILFSITDQVAFKKFFWVQHRSRSDFLTTLKLFYFGFSSVVTRILCCFTMSCYCSACYLISFISILIWAQESAWSQILHVVMWPNNNFVFLGVF